MINKMNPAKRHLRNKTIQVPICQIKDESPSDADGIIAVRSFMTIHIMYSPMEAVYISGASTNPIIRNDKRPIATEKKKVTGDLTH